MPSRSGTPEAARRELPETLWVGEILRAHGLRGEVLVAIHSDVPERFAPGSELIVSGASAPAGRLRIAASRPHKGGVLVRFESVDDRDLAEALRGARLEVERGQSPRPPEGFYYFWQLEGCLCVDAEAGELGEVVDLIEDGGGVLLRIAGAEREFLVPFVDAHLGVVDVEAGRIELSLPPGLLETCSSRRPEPSGGKVER